MITRWICRKCNKKWIYPVERCIHCRGEIEKQKGTKIKVAGMTKVSIPSPMHPIVPYNVILLQDEHGNFLPKKTMKDYSIGEIYNEPKAKTDAAVSIVRKKYDSYEALKYSLELINELDNLNPSKHGKLLIKPSVCIPAYDYQAAATSPDILDSLIKILFENGYKSEDIILAEQSCFGIDVMSSAAKSGILEVCNKHHVKFYDISKEKHDIIECSGSSEKPNISEKSSETDGNGHQESNSSIFKFNVYSEALKRKIINIPAMKTNQQFGLSGAVENLLRLADIQTQDLMFENDIEKMLPMFVKALNSKTSILSVGDAAIGMQGQGPTTLGEPAFLNLIFASSDSVALDSAFCSATMLEIPKYIIESSRLNAGKSDVNEIEIVGSDIESLKRPIKTPQKNYTAHPDIFLIDGKACSGCFNSIINLSSQMAGLRGVQLNIIIGPFIEKDTLDKERTIIYGDCAIKSINNQNDIKEKANKLNIPVISEKSNPDEQVLLLKKLLTTKGKPSITPIDKVKTKIINLVSNIKK